MKAAVSKQEITTGTAEQLTAEISELRQRLLQTEQHNQSLKSQLEWFKRQLFGPKSEKRVVVAPGQMDIADLLGTKQSPPVRSPTEKITYTVVGVNAELMTVSPIRVCALTRMYRLR